MPLPRSILHVDMDAFFASIEQLEHPQLRGKPVLVGHDGPRGVVSAASYESRVFGCRSAMPVAVAKRLCPHAVIMPVRFDRYHEISRQIFTIFERFTPAIQPLSIDEAFLDLTGTERLHGTAEQVAQKIKEAIRKETGLTASVGVAPNKFLAKLASDMNKPDGLTILRELDLDRILPPLPISRIWGIGPRTAARLEGLGIKTFGDLRRTPLEVLKRRVGEEAERYKRLASGLDDRPVLSDREAKGISQEHTFGTDLHDPEEIRQVILGQAESVGFRLRRHALQARRVAVKIRYGNFETITRRCTLEQPTDSTAAIWTAARGLFDAWAAAGFRPVRLIGVGVSQLMLGADQLDLFPDPTQQKLRRLDQALDQINTRFGKSAIHRAP